MKKTIPMLIIMAAFLLASCGNSSQNKALSDAKEVAAAIKQMQPGGIPTTSGGWTMTAKIDGKDWSANSLMPPEAAGRIVGDNDGVGISLPYDRRDIVLGEKTKFSHNNAVDIFTKDEVAIWGGYAGEMEITKVDGEQFVNSLTYKDKVTGEEHTIESNGIFVEIGQIPNIEFVKDIVNTDTNGKIIVDPMTQTTSNEGIWAAGDCTNGRYHQNNIAVGDAVKALEDIYIWIQKNK